MRATSQTTIEGACEGLADREIRGQQLRLLNDLYPDKQPTAGQAIKIVE